MLIHQAALLLSAGYLVWYGVFCIGKQRKGPAVCAFVLSLPPLLGNSLRIYASFDSSSGSVISFSTTAG